VCERQRVLCVFACQILREIQCPQRHILREAESCVNILRNLESCVHILREAECVSERGRVLCA